MTDFRKIKWETYASTMALTFPAKQSTQATYGRPIACQVILIIINEKCFEMLCLG
ncbi:MAG: hypothetical protein ABIR81_06495 [Ginsengibacter sp.]